MNLLQIIIVVCLAELASCASLPKKNGEIREIVYRNLSDFLGGGWEPHLPAWYGPGAHFARPSVLKPDLAPLDADSSFGVWSGWLNGKAFNFELYYGWEHPPCEATFVNITVKYYSEPPSAGGFVDPCNEHPSQLCVFQHNGKVEWQVANHSVPLHQRLNIYGNAGTINDDIILLDEVTIYHDGIECQGIVSSS